MKSLSYTISKIVPLTAVIFCFLSNGPIAKAETWDELEASFQTAESPKNKDFKKEWTDCVYAASHYEPKTTLAYATFKGNRRLSFKVDSTQITGDFRTFGLGEGSMIRENGEVTGKIEGDGDVLWAATIKVRIRVKSRKILGFDFTQNKRELLISLKHSSWTSNEDVIYRGPFILCSE